jgi:hypothetical protein
MHIGYPNSSKDNKIRAVLPSQILKLLKPEEFTSFTGPITHRLLRDTVSVLPTLLVLTSQSWFHSNLLQDLQIPHRQRIMPRPLPFWGHRIVSRHGEQKSIEYLNCEHTTPPRGSRCQWSTSTTRLDPKLTLSFGSPRCIVGLVQRL